MKHFFRLLIFSLCIYAVAGGQGLEITPFVGWAGSNRAPLGYSSEVEGTDKDTFIRNGYSRGVRVTFNSHRYYGHEVTYLLTRAKVQTVKQDTSNDPRETLRGYANFHQFSYNFLLYWMPKNEWIRPYWTGGIEARHSSRPNIEGFPNSPTNNYGANYGWGIKFVFSRHAIVRVDLRDTWTGKPYDLRWVDVKTPGGLIRQVQATIGLGVGF